MQAYLERSDRPLSTFRYTLPLPDYSPPYGRTSTLQMFLNRPPNLDQIAEHLSNPAPILTKISLHVRGLGRPTLVLPPTFFGADLSSARTFALHGVALSSGPCKLSHLTKLTIAIHSNVGVPSVVLLDTLEGIPLLQVFDAAFNSVSRPDVIPVNRVVTLLHLEEITIAMYLMYFEPLAGHILSALCFPSERRVSVRSIHTPTAPMRRSYHFPSTNDYRVRVLHRRFPLPLAKGSTSSFSARTSLN